jgi:hypothetical protein
MRRLRFVLPILCILPGCWPDVAAAAERPGSEVVVEAGWARPVGQLGEDFTAEPGDYGFGAKEGLELGFRWRFPLSSRVSLSPGFHVIDFRDYKSSAPEIGNYQISVTSLRYTLELMVGFGDPRSAVRPFAAVSGGWYRNRVVGYQTYLTGSYVESVNTLGFVGRVGLRLDMFEISVLYSVNRFATWRYFDGPSFDQPVDYDWDNFGVRAGWIIPFRRDRRR